MNNLRLESFETCSSFFSSTREKRKRWKFIRMWKSYIIQLFGKDDWIIIADTFHYCLIIRIKTDISLHPTESPKINLSGRKMKGISSGSDSSRWKNWRRLEGERFVRWWKVVGEKGANQSAGEWIEPGAWSSPCDTLSAPTLVVKSGLCPGMIPGIRPCLKFLFLRGGIVLLNNSRTKRCECFSSSHGLSSRFLKNEKISLWKLICQGYWREGYSKWFEIIERMHMPVQVFGDRVWISLGRRERKGI